jgi:RNase P subunit RPR2
VISHNTILPYKNDDSLTEHNRLNQELHHQYIKHLDDIQKSMSEFLAISMKRFEGKDPTDV